MIRPVIDFLFRPQFESYGRINLAFYSIVLCLAAFIGSTVSVVVIAGAVFSSFHLGTGRLKWSPPEPIRLVFFAFAGLFVADLVSAAVHPSGIAAKEVIENLPFLGFAGLYAITVADRAQLLDAVEKTAAIASLLAVPVLLAVTPADHRPEMASGNSSVLALLATVLYLVTIGAADRRWNRWSFVFLAAALCAAFVTVLSGSRAMWLALVLVPVLRLVMYRPLRRIVTGLPALVALMACGAALLALSSQVFDQRMQEAVSEFQAIEEGDLSGSIGQRLRIYSAGYELVLERPLLGYGPGNERKEIADRTLELFGEGISFSHAHNVALSVMLRSGLLGLLALLAVVIVPIVAAARAPKDDTGKAGFFLVCGFITVYLCSGLVGLMLGHDIHDAVFIASVCFSLYLVFGRGDAPQQAGR
ncbi:O-antigen ligase family protein [Hoeflea olei]|uniref:O-antigen ligase-related domain-containing protein n=1 Tax=Hoeflea olei TaxID=1480615 RepID=A0A1C1YRE2_9HYPH|nr:O-antigen ligase family protein [Hoeflea olei]OCW55940.1 hypothetical protein AWJ14_11960 [Hoeflea olei]